MFTSELPACWPRACRYTRVVTSSVLQNGSEGARWGRRLTAEFAHLISINVWDRKMISGPTIERFKIGQVREPLASISDPALRAALQEAHAERLGIWVAIWPVSLLVLSQILEKKMQE